MSEQVTLEQVAAAREAARQRLAAAQARVAGLKAEWDAAHAAIAAERAELERIELAMRSAQRAHLIEQALDAAGIETAEPPMIVVPALFGRGLPDVFELVAVGAGDVGLYVHRKLYRGRARSKTNAIRRVHVPQRVLDVLAELDAIATGVEHNERRRALGELLEGLTSKGARYQVRSVHGAPELLAWQAHGKGDFGTHEGPVKPLPPPGGGRWRWLKIADAQTALDPAN